MAPTKTSFTFSISLILIKEDGFFSTTFPQMSSVSVLIPKVISPSYSFGKRKRRVVSFVASPTKIGKTPWAIKSRIPPWPAFLILNNFLIKESKPKEVIPGGLKTFIIPDFSFTF